MKSFILTLFILLLSSNISFANEKCSSFKKLSKDYIKCISSKIKKKTSNVGLDTTNVKEKKFLTDWFKKKK